MSGWKCLGILPPGFFVTFRSSKFCAPSCLSMSQAISVLTALSTGRAVTWPLVFTTMSRGGGAPRYLLVSQASGGGGGSLGEMEALERGHASLAGHVRDVLVLPVGKELVGHLDRHSGVIRKGDAWYEIRKGRRRVQRDGQISSARGGAV